MSKKAKFRVVQLKLSDEELKMLLRMKKIYNNRVLADTVRRCIQANYVMHFGSCDCGACQ